MKAILKQLQELRNHPEPDELTFIEAAALLRDANDIALEHGIEVKPVGAMVTPAKAIATVNRYIAQMSPERFLTIPEAAEILRVSQAKVAEWIKANRLKAVNVANSGKRPQYRISRLALENITAEKPFKFKHL